MTDKPEKPPHLRKGAPAQASPVEVSSPPCYLAEVDPAYSGYLSRPETIENLNMLLEGERAGSRACRLLRKQVTDASVLRHLREVEYTEDHCCGMLTRHITRLGGAPSHKTGAFYQKIRAASGTETRLDLLSRGQKWVARYLKEMLPKVGDDELYNDLKHMMELHI